MGPPRSGAEAWVTPAQGRWVLVATIVASAMVFIDGSAVFVALPTIQTDLGAGVDELQWIIAAYALFLAALLLLGGVLGDRYGRRKIFLIGLVVFVAASMGCGFAADARQLILGRGIQGVGAALLTPGSLSIIAASFPPERRGRAIGTWAAFSSLTTILGPPLGGFLTDFVSWRAVFFINVPLGVFVFFAAAARVPESRSESGSRRLDFLGAGLATIGLGAATYALVEAPLVGWTSPTVLAASVAGVGLLGAFTWSQFHFDEPMVPPRLFRHRTFASANVVTLLVYGALGGALFLFPINLIHVQGYSSFQAGLAFLPFVLILALFSRTTGGLADRVGPRPVLTLGSIVTGVGFFLLAFSGSGGSYWVSYLPAMLAMGAGMVFVAAPLSMAVMTSVPEGRSGLASGVNNAVSRLAGLLAVAALGAVAVATFSGVLGAELQAAGIGSDDASQVLDRRADLAALAPPEHLSEAQRASVSLAVDHAFLEAFRLVNVVAGLLCVAGGLLVWLGIEPKPAPAPSTSKPEPASL